MKNPFIHTLLLGQGVLFFFRKQCEYPICNRIKIPLAVAWEVYRRFLISVRAKKTLPGQWSREPGISHTTLRNKKQGNQCKKILFPHGINHKFQAPNHKQYTIPKFK